MRLEIWRCLHARRFYQITIQLTVTSLFSYNANYVSVCLSVCLSVHMIRALPRSNQMMDLNFLSTALCKILNIIWQDKFFVVHF